MRCGRRRMAISAGINGHVWRWRVAVASTIALLAATAAGALPAAAAPGSRGGDVTVHVATLSPLVSLIAGVLILIMPRLLNYIVAIYLILVGLIGLFGR